MNQPGGELPFRPPIVMGNVQVVYRRRNVSTIMNSIGSLLFLITGIIIIGYGYNFQFTFPDVAKENTPWIYGFALLIIGLGCHLQAEIPGGFIRKRVHILQWQAGCQLSME